MNASRAQMEQNRTPALLPDPHELARVRPLKSHRMIVDLIGNTTTTTGLTVHRALDIDQYPTCITYTAKDVDALSITHPEFHGE
jgi:hypothetical protein